MWLQLQDTTDEREDKKGQKRKVYISHVSLALWDIPSEATPTSTLVEEAEVQTSENVFSWKMQKKKKKKGKVAETVNLP